MTERTLSGQQIQANCALGVACLCKFDPQPWHCENWGRSSLSAPSIIGRDRSYGGGGQRVARPTRKPKRK